MGRPRKPTEMLELSGAFKKDPQRRRPPGVKETRPLGEPPSRLPIDVVPYWHEIASMVPSGVLTISDRWASEIIARLMQKSARGADDDVACLELAKLAELSPVETRRLLARERISGAELSTLSSLLGRLGMTPADRTRLSIPIEKPRNKFSVLAEQTKAFRPN